MSNIRRAPSGNWRAEYREPTGRKRSRTFKTKKDARAFLATVEADLNRGLYLDPSAGQVLFCVYPERWWAARNVETTMAAGNLSRLRTHLLPAWGDWPLTKIDHLVVQGWVTRLSGRLAPQTVASCHSLLSGIMKSAVRSRVIAVNPCEGVRLPARRKTATAEVTISRWELTELLLPALPLRYRALAATAALARLRWGECVGMRWDAVDLGGGELHVVRVAVEVGGHVMAKPYPKSKAGRRTVPLPDQLVRGLLLHRSLYPADEGGLVFQDARGGTLRRTNFRQWVWLPARQKAELPHGLTFHALRHCYATWLISDGVPVNVVQRLMAHEQASTTLNRYTHAPSGYPDRVRLVLGDVAADPPPAAGRHNGAEPGTGP
ncbi:MAG TPA: tyrosine-type recombinase/integrase [Frankiaceae bacterium]|nr:tyrosine-type recombinase/integrase [Frankiaceae bacterium]